MVKHETLAVVVFGAASLKVIQNTTFQLVNLLKAGLLHIGPSFFAANASRAVHHNRRPAQLGLQVSNTLRKLPKVVDPNDGCVTECPPFALIVDADIDSRHGLVLEVMRIAQRVGFVDVAIAADPAR